MAERSGGGGDFLLLAAGGAALYFFWPQLSSMFSGTVAAPAIGPTVVPANSVPAISLLPAPTVLTIAEGTSVAPPVQHNVTVGFPTTYAPGLYGPTGNATASFPAGVYLAPAQWAQWQTETLAQNAAAAPPPLQGIRRRNLQGSPAAIAQTALNQMRADAGPQVTNAGRPIDGSAPGATPLPGGCWQYGNTPVLVNCPPGSAPPAPRSPANGNCLPGYTMDAAGICSRTADQVLLSQLNSTPYTGPQSMPAAGQQLSPSIIGMYVSTIGVMPGTVLGQLLGLPANPTTGVMEQGNDGFNYLPVNGVYVRQGTATQSTRPTGPIGPRLQPLPAGTKLKGLGWLAGTLPITNATLIQASHDPAIAQLAGNDPRAMLTVPQWNYYYTQASGVLQAAPNYPAIDPHTLISAQQYQNWRQSAGLGVQISNLGVIRNSRPGMFPLGSIGPGAVRQPFVQPGNRNIYRVPGRGAVRMGLIQSGGGSHRWARSPFPRPADWRMAE